MEIVTQNQAKVLKLPQYFTGNPCKRGHLLPRQTNNRTCLGCRRVADTRYCSTEHFKKQNRNAQKRMKAQNFNFRLAANLRVRLCVALREGWKAGSAISDLGCSLETFRSYIESKFQFGMTWENWSLTGWHIDHIRPLASFDLTNRDQFLQAAHYTNMQPLWATDNISKGKNLVNGD